MTKPALSIEPGRLVLSKAGRDAGRPMIVLHVEGEYATVADGRLRKLAKPKRKKIRHLAAKPVCVDSIQEKLAKSMLILDADIRAALETVGYGSPHATSEEGEKIGKE